MGGAKPGNNAKKMTSDLLDHTRGKETPCNVVICLKRKWYEAFLDRLTGGLVKNKGNSLFAILSVAGLLLTVLYENGTAGARKSTQVSYSAGDGQVALSHPFAKWLSRDDFLSRFPDSKTCLMPGMILPVSTYGNYGGPGWTCGRCVTENYTKVDFKSDSATAQPIDDLDTAFMMHDYEYFNLKSAPDSSTKARIDAHLVQNLDALIDKSRT